MEKLINTEASGIYKISNTINDKIYIGSAVNLNHRYREHTKRLTSGAHHNIHLLRHFKKYGFKTLLFDYVELVDNKETLLEREQYWIDYYKNINNPLFNINPTAGSNLGKTFSQEFKDKISRSRKGVSHLSEEEKKKRSERMRGNKYGKLVKRTDEYRKKQSDKSKGEKNGRAILTEQDVIKIKTLLVNGFMQADIARMFNVARDRIWHIKEEKQWKHVVI